MNRFLLDTDTFTLYLQNNPTVVGAVLSHLSDHVAVSVITVQEIWDGWAAGSWRGRGAFAFRGRTVSTSTLRNWRTPFLVPP